MKQETVLTAPLRAHPVFSKLTAEQQERVLKKARRVYLEAGEHLFEYGDKAERFFQVVEGQIKLFRLSPEGGEKVIEIVTPGTLFAEALMFTDRGTYPVSAEALSQAELLAFDSKAFKAVLQESPETCVMLNAELSSWLEHLVEEVNALTLHNATLRVANYLLRLMPAVSPQGQDGIRLPAPKHLIASRLSITPETLSRIFHNLTEAGFITVERDVVYIHDVEGLRACSERAVCSRRRQ